DNNELVEFFTAHQNLGSSCPAEIDMSAAIEKLNAILSICIAVSVLSLGARAQSVKDERQYADGPVTLVTEVSVEYGRFEDYINWLNSTWKPTMEATKQAGIIIDYKVFASTPPSPDRPDVVLWITYKNMAALDRGVEEEDVAKKVICSTDCQNKARV